VLYVERRSAEVGWHATVVSMRYSMAELIQFKERIAKELLGPALPDNPLIGVAPDYLFAPGKVHVQMNGRDQGVLERILAIVPSDALAIDIRPGMRFVSS